VRCHASRRFVRRLNGRTRFSTGPKSHCLRRLSVFADGFELEAAEAVCGFGYVEEFEVAEILGSLVDKSLVVAEPSGGTLRYRLLETIRAVQRPKSGRVRRAKRRRPSARATIPFGTIWNSPEIRWAIPQESRSGSMVRTTRGRAGKSAVTPSSTPSAKSPARRGFFASLSPCSATGGCARETERSDPDS